ncbi:MAG: xanthine dehydrogenase family protein molybdopterin-binding subunit [Verrucomicrobiota bacterium]
MSHWIGQPLPRREDLPLLTGRGQFVDDVQVANPLHVAFTRSPWAHAEVRSVDLGDALGVPGVAAAVSGRELPELTEPFAAGITHRLAYYAMAVDRARYAGEPVAAIAAESRYLAEDAAELVVADYEPLDAVVTVEDALDPAKPVLHQQVGSNVVVDRTLRYGDPDGAFARADLVVTETLRWERYSSTPIETYGVVADYEPASGLLTMWANFMGPMTLLPVLARSLRIPEAKLRVIVPRDIGGSFGIKSSLFPYMAVVGLLAMRTGRPVKWVEDRAEHLIGSSHQPDRVGTRELALTKDGEIIGLRAHVVDNLGAYVRAPEPATTYRPLGNYVGPYRVRDVELHLVDVVSNKVPTGPNRGYGCQQVCLETERALDEAALQLGLDPAEIRRRNLIQADAFPYETPTGGLYDSGDYPRVLELALETAGYAGLRAMQEQARDDGRLVGIGLGLAVDPSISNMGYITVALPPEVRRARGYNPKSGAADWAQVRVDPRGNAVVTMATTPQGQGHQTAVAQVVADELGLSPDDVATVDEFDSHVSVWSVSSGSYSSRFSGVAAGAARKAAGAVKRQILDIGATLLEASADDVELVDGEVRVKGSPDRSVSVRRIAGVAHWDPHGLPEGMSAGIQSSEVFHVPSSAPPTDDDRINSSHAYGFVAEVVAVEVDPVTWGVTILKYASAGDAGTIINPKLVEGQTYGSALHGLGGALLEEYRWDEDGQFLTGTFADYRCLTAAEAPRIETAHIETPSPFTPVGAKGCGESSAETAPAAVANAVADALRPLGLKPSHLPLTPARLWELAHS